MDDNKMNQVIWENICDLLPERWSSIVFYAEYGQESFSMEYYVEQENGNFKKCFQFTDVNRSLMMSRFIKIDQYINEMRKQLSEKDKWTNLTLVINNNGRVKTDYDYSDLSEHGYEYKKQWEERYLG